MKSKLCKITSIIVSFLLVINLFWIASLASGEEVVPEPFNFQETAQAATPEAVASDSPNKANEPPAGEPQGSSGDSQGSSGDSQGSSSESQVSSSEPQTELVIASFETLSKEQARKIVDVGTAFEAIELPAALVAVDTNQSEFTIENVTWVCDGYDAQAAVGTTFIAKAVLPAGYRLAELVQTPVIEILISGRAPRVINDRIIIGGVIYKETEIGGYAFASCTTLSVVILPNSLRTIGSQAFSGTEKLKSATIPGGMESFYYGFYNSGLESVVIAEGVKNINCSAFRGCRSLKSVTLPTSLTAIGNSAFSGCSALEQIVIPEGVTSIGSYAFANCALTEITLPNGITDLPEQVFFGCSKLSEITIPAGVTTIGIEAFRNCAALSKVTFDEASTLTEIGMYAFDSCTALQYINIPDNINTIGSEAFAGCADLERAKIGSGLQTIARGAFPTTTGLISNDSRVQLLLVEYLNQNEDKRPASEWDGKTNILPGAIVAVNDRDVVVDGNITTCRDSELTIYQAMTVTGTLTISGRVVMGAGGSIIVAGGGRVIDEHGNNLPINYLITLPKVTAFCAVTSDKQFCMAGEPVTLTVSPAAG